ncbi:hypothetical protein ABU614_06255 [Lysobacter firmicutimachus]|uniref:Uncharacterized protein n=1 Tax=Lysobacter firmicutimachus TaxID=1792846 RepID=A0AAU8MYU9_9GAMM|nr:hypothetical protein [Lysobacter antibioticus]
MPIAALLAATLLPRAASAGDETTVAQYTGRVGERAVTMYLKDEPAPCGGVARIVTAIYRYDHVSKWLLLRANSDDQGHLALVESGLEAGVSGALMLVRDGTVLKGKWISPDGERLLPARFDRAPTSAKKRAEIEDTLEKMHYENDDC